MDDGRLGNLEITFRFLDLCSGNECIYSIKELEIGAGHMREILMIMETTHVY